MATVPAAINNTMVYVAPASARLDESTCLRQAFGHAASVQAGHAVSSEGEGEAVQAVILVTETLQTIWKEARGRTRTREGTSTTRTRHARNADKPRTTRTQPGLTTHDT